MINVTPIVELFEWIAINHSLIAHNPDAGTYRFVGLNFSESNQSESKLSFPRLMVNGAEKAKPMNGRFTAIDQLQLMDEMSVEIMVIDKADPDDFEAQEAAYDKAKQIIADIVNKLEELRLDLPCSYKWLAYLISDYTYQMTASRTNANHAYGWSVRFSLRQPLTSTSPSPWITEIPD